MCLGISEGYEPKPLSLRLAMVDRALSEPPQLHGSAGVNPFWSEKNQKEVQLLAARPRGLPVSEQSPGMEALPVRDRTELGTGGCTGKGRGSQHSGIWLALLHHPAKL